MFRTQIILNNANLFVNEHERIGLVNRDGKGGTTLIKMLAGPIVPDDSKIHGQTRINIALMPQKIPNFDSLDITTVITFGDSKTGPETLAQTAGQEHEESNELWELSTRVKN